MSNSWCAVLTVDTEPPRRTSSGISVARRVVLPIPVEPASPKTRIPSGETLGLPASVGTPRPGDVRQPGPQVVVAGDQREDRGQPQQDLADRNDRDDMPAGIANDQHADRHHLDRG